MVVTDKSDIRELTLKQITEFFVANNDKAFRAKQVFEWLWKKGATSFEEMTSLSKPMRSLLEQHFTFYVAHIEASQISKDKTIKFAFRLYDNTLIEGVLIPSENRSTVCISTQVGCPLGCKFCATASLGFIRNLSAGEIFDQVTAIKNQAKIHYGLPLTNIVIMGMGEPLLNYDNVMRAIHYITSKDGLEMSPDRITLSTVGIPKMIMKLADDNARFNLSISLHSANEGKRKNIMPVSEHNNLESLTESIKYFYSKTKTRITIEYLLLKDVNDTINDAKELALFCRSFPVKINIIEYNSSPYSQFRKSDIDKTNDFVNFLTDKNIIVNVRRSRGKDIMAACGQLANEQKISDRNVKK